MATKAKTAKPISDEFRARLQARYEDDTIRGVIKSFSTAYFNNGPNAYERLGMELSVADARKANWLTEINEENGKLHGYTLHEVKRGGSTTEVMVFERFHCHFVQQSDKLIEYTGSNDTRERVINGTLVKRYDQCGIIENQDGTIGPNRELYYELRNQYPNEFSSRRYFLLMLTDAEGKTLHSLPICLSLKGTALASFEEGLNNVATQIGALESEILEKQDASPLSILGLSGYMIDVETERADANNGEQTSKITGIKSMGGVSLETIEERFSAEKEELFRGLRNANADFQVKYNKQMIKEAGICHTQSLLAPAGANTEPLALPETI